jgi:hypothetical protein
MPVPPTAHNYEWYKSLLFLLAYRPYFVFNPFYQAVGPMMGLLMCLSLVFPLAMLIRGVRQTQSLHHPPVDHNCAPTDC